MSLVTASGFLRSFSFLSEAPTYLNAADKKRFRISEWLISTTLREITRQMRIRRRESEGTTVVTQPNGGGARGRRGAKISRDLIVRGLQWRTVQFPILAVEIAQLNGGKALDTGSSIGITISVD